ncbi:uncharacterized protein BO72DRAFT_291640 [Aspergillus fijiensis CBS 313.89]|uniref:Uncharacterized protein n=1 Tax=Aspergillus fijiensis CBS 313.89 TaxID=1448319 RepID=A0A8G1RIJ7_9EURO|nr:uncharacterized protein BO72DRAFT_291640 [Aspergillus fijiensis CBS 313.89]RAK72116.1 hypothetical protein BO72DRAFT_291640 [Aspergillus fijiensis CBS 313.89]
MITSQILRLPSRYTRRQIVYLKQRLRRISLTAHTSAPQGKRSTTRLRDFPEFKLPTMGRSTTVYGVQLPGYRDQCTEYLYGSNGMETVIADRALSGNLGTKTPIFGFIDDCDFGGCTGGTLMCCALLTIALWIVSGFFSSTERS